MSDVFEGFVFVVQGRFSLTQKVIKAEIKSNGGDIASKLNENVTHVLSTQAAAKRNAAKLKEVEAQVTLVSEAWLNQAIEKQAVPDDASLLLSLEEVATPMAVGARRGKRKRQPTQKSLSAEEVSAEESEEPAPKRRKTAKTAKKAKAKKEESEWEEEEEEEEEEEKAIVTVVQKGVAPVDDQCPKAATGHVYSEDGEIFDAMLNQTRIQTNNNKYYIIQMIQMDAKPHEFFVWNRWGRVGRTAGKACKGPFNLERAKKEFMSKFKAKTKNNWEDRADFHPYDGKYTLLERAFGEVPKPEKKKKKKREKTKIPDSTLEPRVQDLVQLICDINMMKQQVVQIGYDAQKLPLGNLSKKHIQRGFSVLKKIADVITGNKTGNLQQLSNDYYSLVPHDLGFRRLPVIRTIDHLKEELELVEALSDIEIATKLLKEVELNENPIDSHYRNLHCGVEPVPKGGEVWKIVEKYVKQTHAPTHVDYKLEIQDIFELQREGEEQRFAKDIHNKKLLWHGSRLTNFVGILSQGLRIAPPEAPVTGYMFGKGIYFADSVSKSANYCNTSRDHNIGIALLCEVALGEPNRLYDADYNANQLEEGKHSTWGLGKTVPDPKEVAKLGEVEVPLGKLMDSKLDQPSGLLYNEFIVYDTAQVKMRYLIKFKFNYEHGNRRGFY